MLKSNYNAEEFHDLLSEYSMLREIKHINVIQLLGACTTQDGPLCVIMEYARFGSLKTILRASRGVGRLKNVADLIAQLYNLSGSSSYQPSSADSKRVPKLEQRHILSFAYQIAKGMKYLSDMKVYIDIVLYVPCNVLIVS